MGCGRVRVRAGGKTVEHVWVWFHAEEQEQVGLGLGVDGKAKASAGKALQDVHISR